MLTTTQVVVVLLGVGLAVIALYPASPLSSRLTSWKQKGKVFVYKKMDIFYIDESGSGKDTLICLHGFPTFSLDWFKILPDLKKQFSRIILFDFVGYGFSDKPYGYNYSIFDQADLVESLANALQISHSHLLSHDYGDTVALELVARYKERLESSKSGLYLKSLCLLNGGLFPGKYYPRLVQRILLTPVLKDIATRLFVFPLFKRGFEEIFGSQKPSIEEFEDFYATLCYKDGILVLPGLLRYIQERTDNENRWVGTLKSSPIPVLMVYGPADPVNPPPFQDHFRSIAPQHRLVELHKSIGHYPQWEDPENMVQSYKQFIQDLHSQKL